MVMMVGSGLWGYTLTSLNDTVEKISGIKTETTKEQNDVAWSKVFARKIRMLESSDWTQLTDVHIGEEIRNKWKVWRQAVRNVKKSKFSNPLEAEGVLSKLDAHRPDDSTLDTESINYDVTKVGETLSENENRVTEIQRVFIKEIPIVIKEEVTDEELEEPLMTFFSNNSFIIRDIINGLKKEIVTNFTDNDPLYLAKEKFILLLNKRLVLTLEEKLSGFPPIEVVNEKFDQALDFLSNNAATLDEYPLISLHVKHSGQEPEEVAQGFLEEKKKVNKIILDIETYRLYIKGKVEAANDITTLRNLVEEIRQDGY